MTLQKKCLLCVAVLSVLLLGLPENGLACYCFRPNAPEAFEGADRVVIAKLTSIEDKREPISKTDIEKFREMFGEMTLPLTMPNIWYTLTVEKTYKGDLSPGDEIIFVRTTIWEDCQYSFEDIGGRYLFYLNRAEGTPPRYQYTQFNACSRSGEIGHPFQGNAAADIIYLDKRSEVQGKNRILGILKSLLPNKRSEVQGKNRVSGILKSLLPQQKTPDFDGKKIKLLPQFPAESIEITANKDGIFEAYGIPPGKYEAEPEVPDGWKIDRSLYAGEKISFTIEKGPKNHIELTIDFVPDNAIRGQLLDPSGKPLQGYVEARRLESSAGFYQYCASSDGCESGSTNENGEFTISGLYEGDYTLHARPLDDVIPRNPFQKPLFPGAEDEKQTKVFSMSPKVFFNGVTMQISHIEEIVQISGTVAFSDGIPMDRGVTVYFNPLQAVNGVIINDFMPLNGKFNFAIVKGTAGTLSFSTNDSWFQNCPDHKQLIEKTGRNLGESSIATGLGEMRVSGEEDMTDVKLVFPLPYCTKMAK